MMPAPPAPTGPVAAAGLDIAKQIVAAVALGGFTFLLAKAFLALEGGGNSDDKRERKEVYARLRIPTRHFSQQEKELVEEALILPEDVVSMNQNELMGSEIQEVLKRTRQLFKLCILPSSNRRETVLLQNRGVLLFGPPGTGKTTIAKIVARENNCFFLNITADLLRHKEYGRTEKVVAAIFSIAGKIWEFQKHNPKRPTVIFMDEVDNILGGKETAHEAYIAARSIFAQKWDGIQKTEGMVVIGTTNYPDQLPGFIYRRFQSRTKIPLPTEQSRKEILRKFIELAGYELAQLRDGLVLDCKDGLQDYLDESLLSDSAVQRDPHSQESMAPIISQLKRVLNHKVQDKLETLVYDMSLHPLDKLAKLTEGYSGSDLKDVVFHGMPELEESDKVDEATLLAGLSKVCTDQNRKWASMQELTEGLEASYGRKYQIPLPSSTVTGLPPTGTTQGKAQILMSRSQTEHDETGNKGGQFGVEGKKVGVESERSCRLAQEFTAKLLQRQDIEHWVLHCRNLATSSRI